MYTDLGEDGTVGVLSDNDRYHFGFTISWRPLEEIEVHDLQDRLETTLPCPASQREQSGRDVERSA